jgi:hypothetical protein
VNPSTTHRINVAAPQRFGHETPSDKSSRYALQATGAWLILLAIATFFALPSHGGTIGTSFLMSGLLLAWAES